MAEPPFSGLEGSLGGARRRGAPETLRSEEGFGAGAPEKRNMLWCPENFAERGISRKITCRYPKRQ